MLLVKLIALIGIVPWCISPIFALLLRQFVPLFHNVAPKVPPKGQLPRLSVLIPACNEEDTIDKALRTLLCQDYPNLEIVVVNDRSNDQTGEIIDALSREDNRIRTVHVETLPSGWLGKVHALRCAFEQASGEWILFSDADVHFSKSCLLRSILYVEKENLDHLALLPKMTSRSQWARFAIVSALRGILMAVKPWHVNDSTRSEGVGVGAFNLVRRTAFESSAGFEWFKMDVADDVALGQMIKNTTGRSHVLLAHQDVIVEWYPSVEKVFLGLEKNAFAQVARCDFQRGVIVGMAVLWIACSPLILLMLGEQFWAVVPWVGAVVTSIVFHRSIGLSFLDSLGSFLFGDLLMGLVTLRSTWLGDQRGGVIWRGTVYSSAALQEGMRLHFGDWLTEWLNRFR